MRGWVIVACGVMFCAGASFLGDTSLMMGAVAQSWVPYVAVPFAVGFAAIPTTLVRAGLVGALSSLTLVVAFYAAGNPARTGGYSVDTGSIFFEYGPLSLVTGFVLAASAHRIAPRAAAAPGRWALACCCFLTLALIASWTLLGWGVHEVTTSSGVVTVGASTMDVVASSAIVLVFSCAVIAYAIDGLSNCPREPSLGRRVGPRS
ncbi:MAG: hypothetical protein WCF36_03570 [Candidatus Nanopelagicales bacterium]